MRVLQYRARSCLILGGWSSDSWALVAAIQPRNPHSLESGTRSSVSWPYAAISTYDAWAQLPGVIPSPPSLLRRDLRHDRRVALFPAWALSLDHKYLGIPSQPHTRLASKLPTCVNTGKIGGCHRGSPPARGSGSN
jgi:hypothetical protein